MQKAPVIHPFLFAVFPILFLYDHNIAETPAHLIIAPLALSLGATAILLGAFRLALGSTAKAGLIVSAVAVVFFNYGLAYTRLRLSDAHVIANNLPALSAVLLFGVIFLAARRRGDIAPLTNLLNITVGAMVAISLIGIGSKTARAGSVWNDLGLSSEPAKSPGVRPHAPEDLPDVYYIILDSYPRADTLRDVYSFDNRDFIDFLEGRGFFVADQARSNYSLTYFSLASSLNMEHLEYLPDKVGRGTRDTAVPARMIEDNKVMKLAKTFGYKTVHFASGWSGTDYNGLADLEIDYGSGDEFTMLLVQTTALKPFDARLGFVRTQARQRILSIFRRLGEIPKMKEPTFTFAHMVPPHPPFFFGANGEEVERPRLKMQGMVWTQKQKYLDQLVFVNKKVKVLVDKLLEKSDKPPIIIIQADHGTASSFYMRKEGNWVKPTDGQVQERMRILSALYAPRIDRKKLRADMTPVNTFRLIFNEYFETDFELQDNKSLYSHYQAPYKFNDMTERVKSSRITE